jgi:hypothetical protein
MNMASKALHDKAVGAMYSIIRNINKHYACRFDILLELFDKMVLPIALYNSEVWGTNLLPSNKNNNDFYDIKFLSRHIGEKLHIKYLKLILGINQKSTNWGVLGETGRFPIVINVMSSIIKYLFHLHENPSNIVTSALATNINLANMGHNTWFRYAERILRFVNLEHLLYTVDEREINVQLRKLKNIFRYKFKDKWAEFRTQSQSGSKLELFVSLKEEFEMSNYLLNSKFPSYRIALSKIRLSAHGLPIETGRYDKIPRENRICPFGCNNIGDEVHYLFQCSHPFFAGIRNPLVNKLANLHPDLNNMDIPNTAKFLLNATTPQSLGLVGGLCYKVLKMFSEITAP